MAKTAHSILAVLSFTVTLFTAGHALAAGDESMALVLHVDNYARVPPVSLVRAEALVSEIYQAAGVALSWVHDDPNPIMPADGGRHLRVLLLKPNMTDSKANKDQVPDNVLGQAAFGSTRAYIFTQRVRDQALKNSRSFDWLLGQVVAHEVGHLLLPPNSHSKSGIMREHLDGSLRRTLDTFTASQGEALRLALNR